ERADLALGAAFGAKLGTEILHRRVLESRGEVEQDAVGAEVRQGGRIEILDRGEVAVGQQARPVVVGAHLHAALVAADRGGGRLVRALVPGMAGPAMALAVVGRIESAAQCIHRLVEAPDAYFGTVLARRGKVTVKSRRLEASVRRTGRGRSRTIGPRR